MANEATDRQRHQGEPSTADFRAVGLPLEAFLRFSQLPQPRRDEAVRVFWLTYGDRLSGNRVQRDLERVRAMRRDIEARTAALEATRIAAEEARERAARAIANGGSR